MTISSRSVGRSTALRKMCQHMQQAWLLYYGTGFLMLLPSLIAWLKLPPGETQECNGRVGGIRTSRQQPATMTPRQFFSLCCVAAGRGYLHFQPHFM